MAQPAQKQSLTIMIAAALAAFIATFNETFLNVGFTPMMADFGVDVSTIQWLATAYMLGAAVMTPTAGFFMRSFGTKPLFLATTSTLIIGGIITALAPNFGVMLVGRIFQSIGTGLLVPIGMMIALTVAPRPKLGTFMGIMGAMTTLGPSVAILVSGVILEFAHWRALCWSFTGLAVVVFIIGLFTVYNISENARARLDMTSVILVAIALIGLLYGISTIFGPAKLVATIAFVVGLMALWLFVKRQNNLDDPLINLAPLRIYPFTAGVLINIVALIIVFAMNILVPTHLQSVHGTTGLQASLVLFPAILLAVVFGPVAGQIYDKQGAKHLLPVGMALMAVFSVATAWAMGGSTLWLITVLYMPAIVGSAMTIGPVQSFALSTLPRELNPHGVTIFSTSFQIAGCIGVALSTGIYGAVIASGGGTDEAANNGMLWVGIVLFVMAVIATVLGWTGTRATVASPTVDDSADEVADTLVSTLMKRDIYHLHPNDTIRQALHLFVDKRISGVPLIEDGRLAGFVSDGDVLNAIGDSVPAFTTPYALLVHNDSEEFETDVARVLEARVSTIATPNVITVNVHDDLGQISTVLAEKHLKKAPVVNDHGSVVGIINRSDINRYLVTTYVVA
ncbi:MFS transporter [Corynebacterium cystitidis]|uniref:MFS transporter, DHA2 family, lincomycin resistance protein n=1 Tax=Corynebacterium cystitidis DSM 20524 TaxID=1121357 RepID=A0A1H9TE33_9CORY|nr:MFS transporter [Corynebacterium cystitidis]WJY83577.1 putative transport protein HsrA [Corynebacterium cystitidis DSM 20524]SER95366.1 MFS transporter, DHA2 family, lincomycin resistance protein [Corynebacterium cystitidis DSM 20524]SNV91941.1 major facilitator superfamily permease [Corynebacterium cystitidis]